MVADRSVLVLGGTGLLGYHAVGEFLRRNWRVTVLALPTLPQERLFPPEVKTVLADFSQLTDTAATALLAGNRAAVFAAGADDRTLPKRPAYEFFHRFNVEPASRFFGLARRAGVGRGVLLSSYFAHFNSARPDWRLAEHHPYIRSRVEQEAASFDAAGNELQLLVLHLPYIFGAMPGRIPLWAPLLRYLRTMPVIFFPKGGTNAVAVEHVAEAIAGAAEGDAPAGRYVVGDENLTWRELLGRLLQAMNRHNPIVTAPDFLLSPVLWLAKLVHRLQGRESGLDPVEFLKVETAETYLDTNTSRSALGYGSGGLDAAFAATVRACLRK